MTASEILNLLGGSLKKYYKRVSHMKTRSELTASNPKPDYAETGIITDEDTFFLGMGLAANPVEFWNKDKTAQEIAAAVASVSNAVNVLTNGQTVVANRNYGLRVSSSFTAPIYLPLGSNADIVKFRLMSGDFEADNIVIKPQSGTTIKSDSDGVTLANSAINGVDFIYDSSTSNWMYSLI